MAMTILAASGCSGATTLLTQVWRLPEPITQPMKSMIIFVPNTDEVRRRAMEDRFVVELSEHGVFAVQSYRILPGTLPEQDRARELVKGAGFDGVLVASMKDVHERPVCVPGTYAGGAGAAYYGTGVGNAGPGYVLNDEVITFETTLWDTRAEDQLVWAALTKTSGSPPSPNLEESLSDAVIEKLEKSRLIPPERRGGYRGEMFRGASSSYP